MTLQRQDIITDDALMAPAVLSKEFEKLLTTINTTKEGIKKANAELSGAKSTGGIAKGIKEITDAEKEVIKIQGQLSSALAKSNDEYVEYKRLVNDVNKAVADKVKWGGLDATQVNAQNSSITKLNLALQKNRQAYANLRTEQERSSKSGQALLKTIQTQDADIKKLNGSMGKFTDNVGDYKGAMEGLDGVVGGVIGRFKMLGEQFLALLKNPFVVTFAALIAVFVALKSAASSYYETTAEGEESLKEQEATWEAFVKSRTSGWNKIGKAASGIWAQIKESYAIVLNAMMSGGSSEMDIIKDQLDRINKLRSKNIRDHAQDVVDDAQTELDTNKLLEISRNKIDFSAAKRLAALDRYSKLKNEQLEGDITLAKDDLRLEEKKLETLGRNITFGKMINTMTAEELKNTGLMEQEVTDLAAKQAALIKVESDAAAARTSMLKLRKSTVDEIHDDEIKKLQEVAEASIALAQEQVQKEIKIIQDKVIAGTKIKADGDKEIANIQKANAAALIQAQIDALTVMMNDRETNAEEDVEIAKRIAKLKIDLNNAVYNSVVTLDEAIVKSGESTFQKLKNIYAEFIEGVGGLFHDSTERNIQALDKQMAQLEESTSMQLKLAGDNDAAKKVIEDSAEARREQLEEKKRKEQIKQARFDKANAVIMSIFNTKLAYTAALAKFPGPPATIPNAILAGVLGAIQTAAIAAKPIPQFFKGTASSPEGAAWVGERGSELKITPSGQVSLTPSTPTLDYLQRGTRIVPHDETVRMLALSSLGNDVVLQKEQSNQIELARSLKKIEKNTRKFGNSAGNLYKQGSLTYEQKIKEDGSRRNIRRSMLGR